MPSLSKYFYILILIGVLCCIEGLGFADITSDVQEYAVFTNSPEYTSDINKTSVRATWIARLEKSLNESSNSAPGYYNGLDILADLYKQSGGQEESIAIYNKIEGSGLASPDLRMAASLNIVELYKKLKNPPENIKYGYAKFNGLVEEFQKMNGAVPDFFLRESYVSPAKEALYAIQHAQRESILLRNAGKKHDAEEILEKYFSSAKQLVEQYLASYNEQEALQIRDYLEFHNFDRASMQYKYAEICIPLSEFYHSSGQSERSNSILRDGIGQLSLFFENNQKHKRFSQGAAVLLLDMNSRTGSSPKEIVDLTLKLSTEIVAGHAFLNYLIDQANKYANLANAREEANELYDLLFDLEKTWFPDEYQEHVNYLVGKLEKTANLINMEQLSEAKKLLDELKALGIQEEWFSRRFEQLNDAYAQIFTELAQRLRIDKEAFDLEPKEMNINLTQQEVSDIDDMIDKSSQISKIPDTSITRSSDGKTSWISIGLFIIVLAGGLIYLIKVTQRRKA